MYKQDFQYVLGLLKDEEPFGLGQVQDLHALLVDCLQHDRGLLKQQQNAIVAAEFRTASTEETLLLMRQWADNLAYRLNLASNDAEVL